jgi:DNA-binding transcriptional ArsR family regulator
MQSNSIFNYIMALKQVTHIVLVGHTKDVLINSVKQFPVHKVILVIGKDPNVTGESKVYDTANEIERELKSFANIEQREVDKLDVFSGAIDILKLIKEEKAKDHDIKINISGSLRTIGIACYIAALVTDTEIYSALPEYDSGKVVGIKGILNVPLFPVKEISDEQMRILTILEGNGVASVEELITKLKPDLVKETKEYANERARLSHHLNILRKGGLLESEKTGKNVKLSLSRIGEIYVIAKEI